MKIPNFTIVLGVDANHLKELSLVLPTWLKHKHSLIQSPWLIFFDRYDTTEDQLISALQPLLNCSCKDVRIVSWPPNDVFYQNDTSTRFGNSQRAKMLAGFIHIPAELVETPYWLKLDLDVIATGNDSWIEPSWFEGCPAIISHPWSYTKPADQMLKLDQWVDNNQKELLQLASQPPLNLKPNYGWSLLRHKRIISWCGFFETRFTEMCSSWAHRTVGFCQLPVPSQDGYFWYCARRAGYGIVRTCMKSKGWVQFSRESQIEEYLIKNGN